MANIDMKKNLDLLQQLENIIDAFSRAPESEELINDTFEAIRLLMDAGVKVLVPIDIVEGAVIPDRDMSTTTLEYDEVIGGDAIIHLRTGEADDGEELLICFTSVQHVNKGEDTITSWIELSKLMAISTVMESLHGIMMNPWSDSLCIPEGILDVMREYSANAPIEPSVSHEVLDVAEFSVDFPLYTLERTKDTATLDSEKIVEKSIWDFLERIRENHQHHAMVSVSDAYRTLGASMAEDVFARIMAITICDWFEIHWPYGIQLILAFEEETSRDVHKREWDAYFETKSLEQQDQQMLEQAISYALECHGGQRRKGDSTPYIMHPLEVMQMISAVNKEDYNLMIAGVLHDVLEDTEASCWDIRERFGVDVARLVQAHTEDKSLSWFLRKSHAIQSLDEADRRVQVLVLADKVSNLRSMFRDYVELEESLWERFNAPRVMQSWYYSKVNDGLKEMGEYQETEALYKEMTELYKDLFVMFIFDERQDAIYQLTEHDENYIMSMESLDWSPVTSENIYMTEEATPIPRQAVEAIEEMWKATSMDPDFDWDAADDFEDFEENWPRTNTKSLKS